MFGQKSGLNKKQLDVARMCYQYVYLCGRLELGGSLSSAEKRHLAALRLLFDKQRTASERRKHRRQAAFLPALVKAGPRLRAATVINYSGSGMLVTSPRLEVGSMVQVTIGSRGQAQYIFTCQVVRQDELGYGLRFVGIPLEIRYGNYQLTQDRAVAAC
jgi:hypothetical protein